MNWHEAGLFMIGAGCGALAPFVFVTLREKIADRRAPVDEAEYIDLDYALGSAVRHKSGVFDIGYVTEIDEDAMTAKVSLSVWHSPQQWQLYYLIFSVFEIEKTLTHAEHAEAKRLVE